MISQLISVKTLLLLVLVLFSPESWFSKEGSKRGFVSCFSPKPNPTVDSKWRLGGKNDAVLFLDQNGKKKGYQFGDISKAIGKRLVSRVNDLTGKEEYEFGDFSKWIDSKVKDKVNDMTGKEMYEFGDLTKELLRRVRTHEYDLEEIIMILKAISALGVGMSSVGGLLPAKVLIDLLEFSLLNDIGNKFVSFLTSELDRRMKKALTGNADYQLGDITKAGFLKFIEKDTYEFGDISKTIQQKMNDGQKDIKILDKSTALDVEFDQWDEALWKEDKMPSSK